MIFNEYFTLEVSSVFLAKIQENELLTDFDNSEFYLFAMSCGRDRDVSDIVVSSNDLENGISILANLFVKKNLDRWQKINNSLSASISAYELSSATTTSTHNTETHDTNNFDYYGSESNVTETKDKLNTSDSTHDTSITETRTARNNINFDNALNNFIKATKKSLIDIIVSDLIDFLTLDIYR